MQQRSFQFLANNLHSCFDGLCGARAVWQLTEKVDGGFLVTQLRVDRLQDCTDFFFAKFLSFHALSVVGIASVVVVAAGRSGTISILVFLLLTLSQLLIFRLSLQFFNW